MVLMLCCRDHPHISCISSLLVTQGRKNTGTVDFVDFEVAGNVHKAGEITPKRHHRITCGTEQSTMPLSFLTTPLNKSHRLTSSLILQRGFVLFLVAQGMFRHWCSRNTPHNTTREFLLASLSHQIVGKNKTWVPLVTLKYLPSNSFQTTTRAGWWVTLLPIFAFCV